MRCQANTRLKDMPDSHYNNQQTSALGHSDDFGWTSKHNASHFVGRSKYFVTTLQMFPIVKLRSEECTTGHASSYAVHPRASG